jgi:hypothetical protein
VDRADVRTHVRKNPTEPVHDPDEGLDLAPELQARLERQLEQVRAGERGIPLADLHLAGPAAIAKKS